MKGITWLLRGLSVGEQLVVSDMERCALYKIATKIGIKVSCKKFEGGFLVTRVS